MRQIDRKDGERRWHETEGDRLSRAFSRRRTPLQEIAETIPLGCDPAAVAAALPLTTVMDAIRCLDLYAAAAPRPLILAVRDLLAELQLAADRLAVAGHPVDADLVALEARRAALRHRIAQDGGAPDDSARTEFAEVMDALAGQTAEGLPGLTVKLRVLLDEVAHGGDGSQGRPWTTGLARTALETTMRLADAEPRRGAFAEAVAAFEAEAPAMLPLTPTTPMVEAGAEAAGLTEEQVRTAYAAMAARFTGGKAA
ncbi:hypothetical protein [Azospirillum sp. ST 5-10]|uniref:hypothetical protein n=1 Tax=unclassified Azospirillum TaxID=2630922 RepID=UPI003F4A50B2